MQISDIISLAAITITILGIIRQWLRDRAAIKTEARETDAKIDALLEERAAAWIERQDNEIAKQNQEIASLEKRIEDLEELDVERRGLIDNLQEYNEYLLAGIRVLMRRYLDEGELPPFDPISFKDFIGQKERGS